jgi:ATP-dependent protease ClpP protease subunit
MYFIFILFSFYVFLCEIYNKIMAQIEIKGEIGAEYTYSQFITDYSNAKGEAITLFIDSVGGSVTEGNQIADFIRSHADQFSRVINTGNVASIAASIFLALPFEKRFFDMSKGVALIHNPFVTYLGDGATAEDLQAMSDLLLSEQKSIQSFIAKQTGADPDVIAALMQINEPLTESQLTSINFANILKIQAIAYLNLKTNDMDTKELEQIIDQKNQTFLDKLLTIFKPTVKAIMVTDANGNQIEFPDVPDGGVVKVGDKTTAPDGKVVMATGEIYVIKGGVLSEIIPVEADPASAAEPNAEIEALKAENEALKKQLAGATAKVEEIESIKAQLATFKSQMVSTGPIEAGQKIVTNRFV